MYLLKDNTQICAVERVFNTKEWVREGNVPPPTWSTKLKVIYGLKTSQFKQLFIFNKGTFYMCIVCMNDGYSQGACSQCVLGPFSCVGRGLWTRLRVTILISHLAYSDQ